METRSFEDLRPPRGVYKIKHPRNYSNLLFTPLTAYQRIIYIQEKAAMLLEGFTSVFLLMNSRRKRFLSFRNSSLQTISASHRSNPSRFTEINPLLSWTRSHSLRYLYASKFNLFELDGCVDRIEKHTAFIRDPAFQKLSEGAENILVSSTISSFLFI